MKQVMYRICPGKTFTLNNRWHHPVFPKYHVFFIPYDGGYFGKHNEKNTHINTWIHFLKFTKHRNILFLYTVVVEYSRIHERILKTFKNKNLIELMIPANCLGHIMYKKVQTV